MLIAPMASRWRGADRLDGQRQRAGRALRPAPAAVLATSSSSSRRSPTRRSTRSASRSSCRWPPASGRSVNLLDESPEHAHQLVMDQPILRNHELETLRHVSHDVFRAHTIDITWPVAEGAEGMVRALADVCDEATDAIAAGINILILSDRRVKRDRVADPVAAGGRRRAPPPGARGHAPARRPGARVGRAARGPPLRDADRLRRERDQPVPAVRHRRRAGGRRPRSGRRGSRRRRAPASSRRSARACSRRSRRWGSRRSSPTAARRSSRRSGSSAGSSTATSPARRRASAASASTCSPRRRSTATRAHTRRSWPATCCPSAASTPGAATASSTCGTRRRSRCSSTRCARRTATPQEKYREYARAVNEEATRACTLRGLLRVRTEGREPIALEEVEPRQRDRQALRHRRDVARLDLHRGARDAGDRDEPPRRPLEHRRGRARTRGASSPTATAICAARRSSRSPRGASA